MSFCTKKKKTNEFSFNILFYYKFPIFTVIERINGINDVVVLSLVFHNKREKHVFCMTVP